MCEGGLRDCTSIVIKIKNSHIILSFFHIKYFLFLIWSRRWEV